MAVKSSGWISGATTVAALLSVSEIFSTLSLSISQSVASSFLFASSFFGLQRLYALLADVLVITIKRPAQARETTR